MLDYLTANKDYPVKKEFLITFRKQRQNNKSRYSLVLSSLYRRIDENRSYCGLLSLRSFLAHTSHGSACQPQGRLVMQGNLPSGF